ncbi:MAG: heavy metal translocating P-type ATPase [Bacilli bacterium]|nr:heavy metal translocating P-type ATPase [Bacilli bacterium]
MGSILKKYFILKNIDNTNTYRKIEIALAKRFKNGTAKINPANDNLIIEFNSEDNLEEDLALIFEVIKEYATDVEIEEKEAKIRVRKTLILENLDCANCAAKIERIAKRTFDHEFIVVDFATSRFIIETTDKNLLDNLQKEVAEIALTVDNHIVVLEKREKQKKQTQSIRIERKKIITYSLGMFIFIGGMLTRYLVGEYANYVFPYYLSLIVYLSAYALLGFDLVYGAIRNIMSGRIFDEKFLMTIATLTALFIGSYNEAIFVLIFYKTGEMLQQYAVNYSRRSIANLIDIKPQSAFLYNDGDVTEVDPNEVVKGDIIIVRHGERIPLDGVVMSGSAGLDVSSLTGESLLKTVEVGDEVFSGSINVDGLLKIKVTKAFEDSMCSKIINLVENASTLKSKSENFISKFARYYTPAVVIFAVLLAVILPFLTINNFNGYQEAFQNSIYKALIFLVVSCPCALVISIPLGFFGGIGAASRNGILIKGSNFLEALNNVSTVVFDKTGTLTKGKFKVEKIVATASMKEDDILEYAAHLESLANHPIAKSIVDYYGIHNINSTLVQFAKNSSSNGVRGKVKNKDVLLGSYKFIKDSNLEIEEVIVPGVIIYVVVDNLYVGHIIIKDEIKEETIKALNELRSLGIKDIQMITGDSFEIATEVAESLSITTFHAETSPIDKVAKLDEIKSKLSENEKIAFVGDGVNDAPVLSSADIGIAMGGYGSDVAIEVADIVLMKDDMKKIPLAFKIARKTRVVVIQNIIFALAIKLLVLGLTPFNDLIHIWEAIFADVGVSLLTILNSLRIMRINKKKVE